MEAVIPPGGTRKNFDRLLVLFLGFEFDKLLFPWVAQNAGYIFEVGKVSIIFGGLTGNLHYFFWVSEKLNYRVNS